MKFLVINGVNLNLTGKREKGVYGSASLDEINDKIAAYCTANGDGVEFYQIRSKLPPSASCYRYTGEASRSCTWLR